MHIGKAEIATRVAEGELFVIKTEQIQNGRVEVVDVDFVFHRGKTEFIRGAMDVAAFCAAPGDPGGEAVVVVVAAINFPGV